MGERGMLTDAALLRDTRPVAELQRALLAESIIRLVHLRGLGRFRRVGEAAEAIAAEIVPGDRPSATAIRRTPQPSPRRNSINVRSTTVNLRLGSVMTPP
jgi:hypothetical protein